MRYLLPVLSLWLYSCAATNPTTRPPLLATATPLPAIIDAQTDLDASDKSIGSEIDTRYITVTVTGEVLQRPILPVDENDVVRVRLVGTQSQLDEVKVIRQSAFGQALIYRIVGAPGPAPAPGAAPLLPPALFFREVELADFAPGEGKVGILPLAPNSDVAATEFSFAVSPLYAGAFSLGPVFTGLRGRAYGLAATTAGQIITEQPDKADQVRYVLSYTHYMWGRRDLSKRENLKPWQHVNPMLALTLNKPLENAMVGVSLDVLGNSFYLQAGRHFGQVKYLDAKSGYQPGNVFTGGVGDIPVQKRWSGDWFAGVSLDLRAAVLFFSTAAKGIQ